MRGDAEAMPRRQRLAGGEIGGTERLLMHKLPAMRERNHAARLGELAHLEIDPAAGVIDRRFDPGVLSMSVHWLPLAASATTVSPQSVR